MMWKPLEYLVQTFLDLASHIIAKTNGLGQTPNTWPLKII